MTAILRPLCLATYTLGETTTVSTGPGGTRLVAEIADARFEGDRLCASLHGRASADWAIIDTDGRIRVDVRMTVKTDDGAIVLITYQGRGMSTTSYSAPLFETGDERYVWLTRIQAVGKSHFDGDRLHYEMFEVV